MPVILGFLIIGAVIGLIPLIVSIIKKRITLGLIILVICAITSVVNIVISAGVAIVGTVLLLFLHKK